MTAIVGICHAGRVYMGGDSGVSAGDNIMTASEPKVWKASGMLLGVAGDMVAIQALKHLASWPRYKGQAPERFLGSHVAPVVRRIFNSLRQELISPYSESLSAELLIGMGGKLFGMDCSGAFCALGNAWAIGSGGEVANGVLYHTTGEEPEDRIMCALEAAEEICLSVQAPFAILWQD